MLHLDAGNTSSYPGTGTTWTDLSGNGNNGILTNGPIYSSNNGGGIVFDGVDDFVNCGTGSTLNLSTSGSLSVWASISNYSGSSNYWAIAGKGAKDGFDTNGYTIWFYTGYVPIGTGSGSVYGHIANRTPVEHLTDGCYFGSDTVLGNTIHNYVLTWDSTTVSTYLDGVLIQATPYSYGAGDTTSVPFKIGSGPNDRYMNGSVYQVAVYNRTITTTELIQNYKFLRDRFS